MKPDIHTEFSTDGIILLPIIALFWGSAWCRFRIHIGWLFWFVEIEWPIE